MGFRGVGRYGRPDQIGARSADPEGFALASHRQRVVVRHGHAGSAQRYLRRLCALEDSPQGVLGGSSLPNPGGINGNGCLTHRLNRWPWARDATAPADRDVRLILS
ncbi:hypothetical protein BN9982_160008 [Mycobacterium tuberculosis]|nr:hypothetical protein BN9982_160008 [Mycobacterium tuberculosis]